MVLEQQFVNLTDSWTVAKNFLKQAGYLSSFSMDIYQLSILLLLDHEVYVLAEKCGLAV